MPDNISPEEKLLNLIKNSKDSGKDSLKVPVTQGAIKEADKNNVPDQNETASQKKGKKTKESVPAVIIKKKLSNPFPLFNRFLILGMLGVLAYMVLAYFSPYESKTKIPEKFEVLKETELAEKSIGTLPPLKDYTGTIGSRKMFKIYEPPKPKVLGPQKPKVTLQQLVSGYTFVGIIFGEPAQAIVEEKRSKQSYYLSAGQLLGEIKIEKIERGKVTVSYGDETMDIRI